MSAKKKPEWSVHLPNLLKEMVESNPGGSALARPANITFAILSELAARAIEIDDPKLNILMLRLALYDLPPSELFDAIKEQEKRLTDG